MEQLRDIALAGIETADGKLMELAAIMGLASDSAFNSGDEAMFAVLAHLRESMDDVRARLDEVSGVLLQMTTGPDLPEEAAS